MKRLAYILLLLFVISCKPVQTVIQKEEIVYTYKDSITYHDSTIYFPKEYYYNVAWPYDTLHLETSLAEADCWVDSLFLRGQMKNKKGFSQQVIEKIEYITKDSIVYKEKPVPYPVEVVKTKNASWWVWLWAILSTMSVIGLLYWSFRGKIYKYIGKR